MRASKSALLEGRLFWKVQESKGPYPPLRFNPKDVATLQQLTELKAAEEYRQNLKNSSERVFASTRK